MCFLHFLVFFNYLLTSPVSGISADIYETKRYQLGQNKDGPQIFMDIFNKSGDTFKILLKDPKGSH